MNRRESAALDRYLTAAPDDADDPRDALDRAEMAEFTAREATLALDAANARADGAEAAAADLRARVAELEYDVMAADDEVRRVEGILVLDRDTAAKLYMQTVARYEIAARKAERDAAAGRELRAALTKFAPPSLWAGDYVAVGRDVRAYDAATAAPVAEQGETR